MNVSLRAEGEAIKKIGKPGFEPGTSCSQSKRASQLRYSPVISRIEIGII